MIAVRCFSLCAINGPQQLLKLDPARWQQVVPDLKRIAVAGELRGQGIAPLLPRGLPRLWLPRLPAQPDDEDMMWRLQDCADALNLNTGRTMLVLPQDSAQILAWRLNWVDLKRIPVGTLWDVTPKPATIDPLTNRPKPAAAVYQFEPVSRAR